MNEALPSPIALTVAESDSGTRLDRFLAKQLPDLSRNRLQTWIESGCVLCDGQPSGDSSAKVKAGQCYEITVPPVVASHIVAQDMALEVVFEDEHMLVINKPAGLTVHPAPGHPDRTLVNALLSHCGDSLSGIGGVARPGIVHRIDKDTSGLLVVAKHDAAHLALSAQLADHSLGRTYSAVVWGAPKTSKGTITGNIGRSGSNRQKMAVVKSGGKPAVTHYRTLEIFNPAGTKTPLASLVECTLETGRTHQIRVHMAFAGNPLLGDPVYGQTTASRLAANTHKSLPATARETLLAFNRQALHARELALIHPHTRKPLRFACDLPPDMQALIAALHNG
jgi:23S rRNA pseudouridine1911/1915/1917 synthase